MCYFFYDRRMYVRCTKLWQKNNTQWCGEKNKAFTKKPQLPHPSGFGHQLWWPGALLPRPQALASTRRRSTVATLAWAPAPVSAPGAHAAAAVGQWGGNVGWPAVPADLAKMDIRRPSQNTGAQEHTFDSLKFNLGSESNHVIDRPGTTLQINSVALRKSGHTHAEGVCLTCCCQQNICFWWMMEKVKHYIIYIP